MNNKHYLLALAILAAMPVGAQNFNPTVEVTNSYRGSLLEVNKSSVDMAVPDSLMKFDLKFDYSVFDKPYAGAYDFTPYVTDMRPQADAYKGKTFYFRGGAGSPISPEADLFYSPFSKGRFKLNVYGTVRSYYGKYNVIRPDFDKNELGSVGHSQYDKVYKLTHKGIKDRYKGHDITLRGGVNGGYDWSKAALTFDLSYLRTDTEDEDYANWAEAMEAKVRVANKGQRRFNYDVSADYISGMLNSEMMNADPTPPASKTKFGDLTVKGSFGPSLSDHTKVLADAEFRLVTHGLQRDASDIKDFNVTPRFVLDNNRWHLSLGVKFDISGHSNGIGEPTHKMRHRPVYPAVYVGYEAIKDHMNIYASGKGGNQIHSPLDFLSFNPFVPFHSWEGRLYPDFCNTIEKYNLRLGFNGNIARQLHFDIYGGYANYLSAMTDFVSFYAEGYPVSGAIIPADYKLYYAGLDFGYDGGALSIAGGFKYQKTEMDLPHWGMELVPWQANLSAKYVWNKRFTFTADVNFAAARKGYSRDIQEAYPYLKKIVIPSYTDLSLGAEYAVLKWLSVWAKVGNILNMDIQRTPLHAERGINFKGGICVNF